MKDVLNYLQELMDQNVSVEELKGLLKERITKRESSASEVTEEPPKKQEVVQSKPSNVSKKLFRIAVKSNDGDTVNIQIPLQLARYVLAFKPKVITKHTKEHDIDFDLVLDMLEQNLTGDFVNIESSDGDTVRIFVE